jgi:phosphonate transport system substrate-binding protein
MMIKTRLLFLSMALHAIAATTALADWRKELGTFRIGLIEAQAKPFSPEDLDRLKSAMSEALKIPVEIFRARDFPSLVDAHVSSRIEYAIYSSAAYATAWIACQCVEPVAAPANADGTSGYKAVLFARPALKLNDLPQTKGVGIPGRDSLIGFGVPLASLTVGGRVLAGNEKWLSFSENASGTIEAYRAESVDAFVAAVPAAFDTKTGSQMLPWLEELKVASEMPVLTWESAVVPFGPHAVRKNLAPEAKQLAADLLAKLPETDPELAELLLPDEAVSFKPVEHGSYALAVNAAKALAAVAGGPSP